MVPSLTKLLFIRDGCLRQVEIKKENRLLCFFFTLGKPAGYYTEYKFNYLQLVMQRALAAYIEGFNYNKHLTDSMLFLHCLYHGKNSCLYLIKSYDSVVFSLISSIISVISQIRMKRFYVSKN